MIVFMGQEVENVQGGILLPQWGREDFPHFFYLEMIHMRGKEG